MIILTDKVSNAKSRYERKFHHEITHDEIPTDMKEDEFCEEIDQAIASGIPVCRYTSANSRSHSRRK